MRPNRVDPEPEQSGLNADGTGESESGCIAEELTSLLSEQGQAMTPCLGSLMSAGPRRSHRALPLEEPVLWLVPCGHHEILDNF